MRIGEHERIGHLHREEEAAALRAQIDTGDLVGIDGFVQEERGTGELMLAGERGEEDAIDVLDREVRLLEGRQSRFVCEL